MLRDLKAIQQLDVQEIFGYFREKCLCDFGLWHTFAPRTSHQLTRSRLALKLYNTLTGEGRVHADRSAKRAHVRVRADVYDFAHIGNARP